MTAIVVVRSDPSVVIVPTGLAPSGPPGPVGSGSNINVQDESTLLGLTDKLKFTGTGVTATLASGTATIDIPGAPPGIAADPRIIYLQPVGTQTLSATSYGTMRASSPITITQQTADGLAINAAIVALRAAGGGELRLGPGTFYTYAFLERIDFPLKITGCGRGVTVIKNTAASPWAHGYGILFLEPASVKEISISDITLDGNATNRTLVAAEVVAYPIGAYGYPALTMTNVESLNSPIDCFITQYENGENGCYVKAVNCRFSNSYRNTVSLVTGWNQQYTNCTIEKGGKVFSGTNPAACLDIEPDGNTTADTIKHITFTNCTFREAINSLLYGVWCGNIRFNGCTFEAKGGTGSLGAAGTYLPYMGYVRAGQFSFTGCTFNNLDSHFFSAFVHHNDVVSGEYGTTGYVAMDDCEFNYGGLIAYGQNTQLRSVTLRNNKLGLIVDSASMKNFFARDIRLLNCAGPDIGVSLQVTTGVVGRVDIDGVDISIEPDAAPAALVSALAGTTFAAGCSIIPSGGHTIVRRVHCSGFYQKFPAMIGASPGPSYRDWGNPNSPPPDTTGDTGSAAIYYRECTMYGDHA